MPRDSTADLLFLERVGNITGQFGHELRIEQLLCPRRPGLVGPVLGRSLAFVRVVAFGRCQLGVPRGALGGVAGRGGKGDISLLRHFWQSTLAGVTVEGPLRPRYGCMAVPARLCVACGTRRGLWREARPLGGREAAGRAVRRWPDTTAVVPQRRSAPVCDGGSGGECLRQRGRKYPRRREAVPDARREAEAPPVIGLRLWGRRQQSKQPGEEGSGART